MFRLWFCWYYSTAKPQTFYSTFNPEFKLSCFEFYRFMPSYLCDSLMLFQSVTQWILNCSLTIEQQNPSEKSQWDIFPKFFSPRRMLLLMIRSKSMSIWVIVSLFNLKKKMFKGLKCIADWWLPFTILSSHLLTCFYLEAGSQSLFYSGI